MRRKRLKLDFDQDEPLQTSKSSELWCNKYEPKDSKSLPVVKKKVEEVRDWFKSSKKCLVIRGQSGCAKSSLVRVMANEHNQQLTEFLDEYSELERWLHELKFCDRIGLIDQLPHSNSYQKFSQLIDNFNYSQHKARLIILVTDFPQVDDPVPTLFNMFSVQFRSQASVVQLNGVIKSTVGSILKKVYLQEFGSVIDPKLLLQLQNESHGDLRLALNQLQYQTLRDQRLVQASEYRESSLSRFHVVGKLLYAKNDFNINLLLDNLSFSTSLLGLYVHENLPQFATLESMEHIMDAYSLAESLQSFNRLQEQVLLSYLMSSLVSKLRLSHQESSGFRPLKSTRWFKYESIRKSILSALQSGNVINEVEKLSYGYQCGQVMASPLFRFAVPQVNAVGQLKDDEEQENYHPVVVQQVLKKSIEKPDDWYKQVDDIVD